MKERRTPEPFGVLPLAMESNTGGDEWRKVDPAKGTEWKKLEKGTGWKKVPKPAEKKK